MLLRLLAAAALVLSAGTAPVLAQQDSQIPPPIPLQAISFVVTSAQSGAVVAAGRTDAAGQFVLPKLAGGDYVLQIDGSPQLARTVADLTPPKSAGADAKGRPRYEVHLDIRPADNEPYMETEQNFRPEAAGKGMRMAFTIPGENAGTPVERIAVTFQNTLLDSIDQAC